MGAFETGQTAMTHEPFRETAMFAKHPVAYSPQYYEKALLSANRFLGVPNAIWGGWATTMVGLTGWFASGETLGTFIGHHGIWLLVIAAVIWLVLRWLAPRHDDLKRAALEEHRSEVQRIAMLHGVDADEVLLAHSEAERQQLELGSAESCHEDHCPTG